MLEEGERLLLLCFAGTTCWSVLHLHFLPFPSTHPPNYPQLPPHTPHNHPLDRAKRR